MCTNVFYDNYEYHDHTVITVTCLNCMEEISHSNIMVLLVSCVCVSGAAANEGVLANFFNSLLSKKTGSPGSPGTGAAGAGSPGSVKKTGMASSGLALWLLSGLTASCCLWAMLLSGGLPLEPEREGLLGRS